MKAVERLEAGFREMGAAAEAVFAAELAEAFAAGAGAGEERNGRVERVERVEENSRVEHKEHKEPGLVGAGVPARPRGASGGPCVSASAGEPAEGGFFNAEKGERGRRGEREPWPRAKLGEVCEIVVGKTPLRSNPEYWENGDVPWFTIDDLRDQGREIFSTRQMVTKCAAASMRVIPKDTVLLCCTASVGATAISRIDITTNQQFNALVIKNRDLLNEVYLYYYCLMLTPTLLALSSQTTINFVSKTKVEQIEIPLPPLAVQRLIVSRLEAAAGRRARIVALADEGAAAAADLRKAILKESFE